MQNQCSAYCRFTVKVNGFNPPLLCTWAKFSQQCVCLWVRVLFLSIFAYAHNVINCHGLSFCLATSPHSLHPHSHKPQHRRAHSHTGVHAYVFTLFTHNVCSQGEMKGNSVSHRQLKTLWNSMLFSFTYSWTVAVSEPSGLSPANMVDFIYGQSPSEGAVGQVKLSICLYSLVIHTQWLCRKKPWAIINYS